MLRDATLYAARGAQGGLLLPSQAQGARWCTLVHGTLDAIDALPRDEQVGGDTVQVRVFWGAWVVDCPCGGAQYACRTDRRMFCPDCRNRHSNGRWVLVEWPDDPTVAGIEAALEVRPYEENRNWAVPETVADLLAENAEHGVDA